MIHLTDDKVENMLSISDIKNETKRHNLIRAYTVVISNNLTLKEFASLCANNGVMYVDGDYMIEDDD